VREWRPPSSGAFPVIGLVQVQTREARSWHIHARSRVVRLLQISIIFITLSLSRPPHRNVSLERGNLRSGEDRPVASLINGHAADIQPVQRDLYGEDGADNLERRRVELAGERRRRSSEHSEVESASHRPRDFGYCA
jgi:hypothetical protein